MVAPLAHVAGLPLEEAVATLGPMLGLGIGALVLALRSRVQALARHMRWLGRDPGAR